MKEERNAIVIGGGLIGLWSAWYLIEQGWQVTLLERDRIGSGASHGNCGYVSPSHVMPLSTPGVVAKSLPMVLKGNGALSIPPRFDPGLWKWLYRFWRECTETKVQRTAIARHALLASAMQLYREFLAEHPVDCEWQDEGLLFVWKSKRDFADYAATAERLQQDFGLNLKAYEGEAVRDLEPALRTGMAGGWHFPDDAHIRPDKLLTQLRGQLEQRGCVIHEHTPVERLRIEAGRLQGLETGGGAMTADLVVLATGAEAPRFARPLGARIPIQPGKGYSFTMTPPAGAPRIPMIFEEKHVAVTPMKTAFRVGSTMQFVGYDKTLDQRRLNMLRQSTVEHLQTPLPEQVDEQWCGWRPMVYDGLPCIDRAPAASNVIVAAGNGMVGLASGTATGKLVAELASEVTPHIDPAPYSLSRFR
ncbi:NAD(P)/FAD-dependent oxidoreductase [Roseimaritima sediminicola]|uniref:NAD(P)/FAD-dependent oxidoreductase n=1 Tax=Roseimaritima sediminicola TaxID=2662066 RepID=UPI0012982459|nr:FAD-dependent oxidoreductase [Roseimaritima sediminicola]